MLVAFVLILLTLSVSAQTDRPSLVPEGLSVNRSYQVDTLLAMHRRMNAHLGGTDGYRVQIFSGSGNESRQQANEVRINFLKEHPSIPAYLVFQSPNYKVRVGDERTELDAMRLKQLISYRFPGGFVVKDQIKFARPTENQVPVGN